MISLPFRYRWFGIMVAAICVATATAMVLAGPAGLLAYTAIIVAAGLAILVAGCNPRAYRWLVEWWF